MDSVPSCVGGKDGGVGKCWSGVREASSPESIGLAFSLVAQGQKGAEAPVFRRPRRRDRRHFPVGSQPLPMGKGRGDGSGVCVQTGIERE